MYNYCSHHLHQACAMVHTGPSTECKTWDILKTWANQQQVQIEMNRYVGPPYCHAEMYSGKLYPGESWWVCWRDRQTDGHRQTVTDARQWHYISARGSQSNNIKQPIMRTKLRESPWVAGTYPSYSAGKFTMLPRRLDGGPRWPGHMNPAPQGRRQLDRKKDGSWHFQNVGLDRSTALHSS